LTNEGYSKEFKRCPACGSEERVMEQLIEPEIEKGNWPAGTEGFTDKKMLMLRNPQTLKLIGSTIPAVGITFDVCADCGTEYAKRIEVVDLPVEIITQKSQDKPINIKR
jgi:hypothetical protein